MNTPHFRNGVRFIAFGSWGCRAEGNMRCATQTVAGGEGKPVAQFDFLGAISQR